MILTDTHAHLYSEAFDEDRDNMIQRAIVAGVERFFIPAIDSSFTDAMLRLKAAFPERVYLMAGLHPTHVKENFEEELEHVHTLLGQRRFYGVGETGIDLYWDKTYLEEQRKAFRYQIRLAREFGLPIVIHCREAFNEIFDVLEQETDDSLSGIFHCFTGSLEQANKAIGYNMKLGIGGVVTYKNGKIDEFLHKIDLRHIVLETDSPYLAPAPFRGKRNESAYLVHVLARVAEIYGKTREEVAEITTRNSKGVFGV